MFASVREVYDNTFVKQPLPTSNRRGGVPLLGLHRQMPHHFWRVNFMTRNQIAMCTWLTSVLLAHAALAIIPFDEMKFDYRYSAAGPATVHVGGDGAIWLIFERDVQFECERRVIVLYADDLAHVVGIVPQFAQGRVIAHASEEDNDILVTLPAGDQFLFSLAERPRAIAGVPMIPGFGVGGGRFTPEHPEYFDGELAIFDPTISGTPRPDGRSAAWECRSCSGGGPGAISCTMGANSVTCQIGYYACCWSSGTPATLCLENGQPPHQ